MNKEIKLNFTIWNELRSALDRQANDYAFMGKEITKKQLSKWKPYSIRKLIYRINDLELLIKNNLNNIGGENIVKEYQKLQTALLHEYLH